jgi:hypothetical protein
MQQFGSDRAESGHRADIVNRSKMTHCVDLLRNFGATQRGAASEWLYIANRNADRQKQKT